MKGHWEKAHNQGSETDDACGLSNCHRREVEDLLLSRVRQVEDKVLETYLLAERVFRRCFELPSIQWDLSGACAGRAIWPDNRIRLNPVLLCENANDFIRETVPHEIAHLLNRAINGRGVKPHGPEWKNIMRALGREPRRCYNYDVTNARVCKAQRHTYKCACRTHSISQRIHNAFLRGALYVCQDCKVTLKPVQSV
jgi:SprT protein